MCSPSSSPPSPLLCSLFRLLFPSLSFTDARAPVAALPRSDAPQSVMAFFGGGSGGLDQARCIKLAIMHDIAEAIVGDITPHDPVSKARRPPRPARLHVCRLAALPAHARSHPPGAGEESLGWLDKKRRRSVCPTNNRRRSTIGSSRRCPTCRKCSGRGSGPPAVRIGARASQPCSTGRRPFPCGARRLPQAGRAPPPLSWALTVTSDKSPRLTSNPTATAAACCSALPCSGRDGAAVAGVRGRDDPGGPLRQGEQRAGITAPPAAPAPQPCPSPACGGCVSPGPLRAAVGAIVNARCPPPRVRRRVSVRRTWTSLR